MRRRSAIRRWAREFARLPARALPEPLATYVADRNWKAAHSVAQVSQRLTIVIEMLVAHSEPEDWPRALSIFLRAGDLPRFEYRRLCSMLGLLHNLGVPVLDGDETACGVRSLPSMLKIYRGTNHAEFVSCEFGFCWTLDFHIASRFAARGLVVQDLLPHPNDSPAVVLTATVRRNDLVGALWSLGEREMLVLPSTLRDVRWDPLELSEPLGSELVEDLLRVLAAKPVASRNHDRVHQPSEA